MGWDRVIGQERVKELLRRTIAGRKIAHAFLFTGGEGVGKEAMAIEFARVLTCAAQGSDACGSCASCRKADVLQHPNIRLIVPLPVGKAEKAGDDPLKGLTEDQITAVQEQFAQKAQNPYHRITIPKANFIKVNSIRDIRREAALSVVEGGKRVFIVTPADAMNAEASNSLLKTLEEPPSDSVFVLVTSQKEQLLQTILSRCQQVQFDPLGEEDIRRALVERYSVEGDQASLIARLANGSFTAALELLSSDLRAERQGVVQFLRIVLSGQRVALASAIENIIKGGDRVATTRWLRMLHVWLRDALVLREHGEDGVLNVDHSTDLKSFVAKFPRADLVAAMESVERSIALVDKNVYLPLVLTGLAIDLRRSLSST